MGVLKDDRQAKAAEASRRTAAVEVTAQEDGVATSRPAVEANPKQHKAGYLLKPAKLSLKMASSPAAMINNTSGLGLSRLSDRQLDAIRRFISYLCRLL